MVKSLMQPTWHTILYYQSYKLIAHLKERQRFHKLQKVFTRYFVIDLWTQMLVEKYELSIFILAL